MIRFVTSTTYGQWLPGDERGFVSNVKTNRSPHRVKHNSYASPIDADMPGLRQSAQNLMKGDPVFLGFDQATVLLEQFQETAEIRRWTLIGAAVMTNHFHALVEMGDEENPDNVLRDLKSYGSRKLNRLFGKPSSGTWWTAGGSNRPKNTDAIPSLIQYIRNQSNPLIIWIHPNYENIPPEPRV